MQTLSGLVMHSFLTNSKGMRDELVMHSILTNSKGMCDQPRASVHSVWEDECDSRNLAAILDRLKDKSHSIQGIKCSNFFTLPYSNKADFSIGILSLRIKLSQIFHTPLTSFSFFRKEIFSVYLI